MIELPSSRPKGREDLLCSFHLDRQELAALGYLVAFSSKKPAKTRDENLSEDQQLIQDMFRAIVQRKHPNGVDNPRVGSTRLMHLCGREAATEPGGLAPTKAWIEECGRRVVNPADYPPPNRDRIDRILGRRK
jgi:hypothetical protein